jgi:hypothetical protein
MLQIENFAILIFILQVAHSIEELTTGFHKKWYFRKLSFNTFLLFEIVFTLFWASVIFIGNIPFRKHLLLFFIALMFANGIQHLVWFGSEKKYVPGLITGLIHIIAFLAFFFQLNRFI